MQLQNKIQEINGRLKRWEKRNKKFGANIGISFVLFIILFFSLIFFPEKAIIIIILFIGLGVFTAFVFKDGWPHLINPEINNNDRIVLNLARLAGRIEKYITDSSLNTLELKLAKTYEYKNLKRYISISLNSYQKEVSIERKNIDFLENLKYYVETTIFNAIDLKLNATELQVLMEKLKILAEQIYLEKFGEAKNTLGEIDKTKIQKNSILNEISWISISAHTLTITGLGYIVMEILKRYPISNLQDLESIISILFLIFLGISYDKIQKIVKKIVEIIISFTTIYRKEN